jgi:hypothetical protein
MTGKLRAQLSYAVTSHFSGPVVHEILWFNTVVTPCFFFFFFFNVIFGFVLALDFHRKICTWSISEL